MNIVNRFQFLKSGNYVRFAIILFALFGSFTFWLILKKEIKTAGARKLESKHKFEIQPVLERLPQIWQTTFTEPYYLRWSWAGVGHMNKINIWPIPEFALL